MEIGPESVGEFIDSIAGTSRTPAAVAMRLLDEAAELCLSNGLTAGEILAGVVDSLHNQALKASSIRTVFPSELGQDEGVVNHGREAADVYLVLCDYAYVSKLDLDKEASAKWNEFTAKDFRVAESGVVYAVKPHIKGD